jgi:hypothetical protein
MNSAVDQGPLLYLFIIATVLLALGYFRGARRNRAIAHAALNALTDGFGAKDQEFTNIGGLTGYHARFLLDHRPGVDDIEATVTLLPRQSLLFMPFALLFNRHDRLFLSINLSADLTELLVEGHLIERQHLDSQVADLRKQKHLESENLRWDGNSFVLFFADSWARDRLVELSDRVETPEMVRHIALVPSRGRLFAALDLWPTQIQSFAVQLQDWLSSLPQSRGTEIQFL